ncbi:hypothetical protein SeLEV6574_g06120 [Synchytrium endobioticum]|uniref:VPS9 domain-containing protein n=1 Tax=Synchytrium endobioticum TaxID=286115 RepID=A0A507CQG8_9FUNG|nr:hypothetical protein SeLEV6574_g06120 [Synchytrium endobioticum]
MDPIDPLHVVISSQPFFNVILHRFPHYLSNIHVNDWTLCLPATGISIQANSVTQDFLATHVLRPTIVDDEYLTVNNKLVHLVGQTLATGRGFAGERVAHILADILYKDDLIKPINIYLIDIPLVKQDTDTEERHIAESATTLPLLLHEISRDSNALKHIDGLISQFNDQAITLTDLDILLATMNDLLSSCFDIISSVQDRLEPILTRLNMNMETFYQIAETYVMEQTYEVTYFILQRAHRSADMELVDCMTLLQELDLNQMGLRPQWGSNLISAVKEFSSISILRTPFEKIKCVMRSIYALTGSDPTMTSDQLIPLLIFMLIRSNQINLISSLYYMKRFIFEHDVVSGELGYALSSLDAVIAYIKDNREGLADISSKNRAFWQAAIDGNLTEIQRVLHLAGYSAHRPALDSLTPISPSKITFPFLDESLLWRSVSLSRNSDGDNALLLATQHRQIHVVRYLCDEFTHWISGTSGLQNGGIVEPERLIIQQHPGDPNSRNYTRNTPLHKATNLNDLDLVSFLFESGVSLESRNDRGETPLLIAARLHNQEMISHLMSLGAEVNARTAAGTCILHLATLDLIPLMMKATGIDPNIVNNEGLTPVLYHCQQGRQAIVLELIKYKDVDVNAKDLGHRTPLHLCSFRGYTHLVEQLLSKREIAIDETSLKGNTCLHAAADADHMDIVLLLLQAGADPTIRNLQGKSAADLSQNEDMIELLDNYALFRLGSCHPKDRVASVARAIIDMYTITFVVKSGLYPDVESITTVKRELKDFAFLRQQLLIERPEACIPDLKDLVMHPLFGVGVQIGNPSLIPHRQVRRTVRRLHRFLNFLLQHPALRHHELVYEFCVVGEIEEDMIVSRTAFKVEHEQQVIMQTIPSVIHDLDNKAVLFANADMTLTMLGREVKQVGLMARRLGRARKDLANSWRTLRWHLSRPSSLVLDNKIFMVEFMRKVADIMGKQSLSDVWDAGEPLYESHRDFVLNVSKRHEDWVSAYQTASRNTALQVTAITRLEVGPRTLVRSFMPNILTGLSDGERARKLSEMYYQLERLQETADKSAAFLNHAGSQLMDELSFFHRKRADDVINGLSIYTRRQYDAEVAVRDAVQDALAVLDEAVLRKQQQGRMSVMVVDSSVSNNELVVRQDEPRVNEEEEEEEGDEDEDIDVGFAPGVSSCNDD